MSNQLKPCPFCRNADEDEFSVGNGWLICDSCGAYFEGVADDHWNTRPIEDDLRARLAAAEERVVVVERQRDVLYDALIIDLACLEAAERERGEATEALRILVHWYDQDGRVDESWWQHARELLNPALRDEEENRDDG